MTLEQKCITTIRCLAIDAVEKANSGHPGAPMALAPTAFALWMKVMKYNPKNPQWFDRDRFVLSNGHASILQYVMLHLTGYEVSLEDLKNFRQLGSITAGHPEYGLTPGIETTTGPLGQGLMTAVGMAMAEAHLASIFNKTGNKIVDHHTYVICSDGDLMEGASHEAGSIAGHFGLGKIIVLYDNNHITIEGNTDLTYSDDVSKRFEAYHWDVQSLNDDEVNDPIAITTAIDRAKEVLDKPSMILLRTHIGYGSPNKQDTSEVHGNPLGEKEIKLTKENYGWPEQTFYVPEDVKTFMSNAVILGKEAEQIWNNTLTKLEKDDQKLANSFHHHLQQKLPDDWISKLPVYTMKDGEMATRKVTTDVVNALSKSLPWLIGGSADLGESTSTLMEPVTYFGRGKYENRNIDWGIREHLMCAAATGLMVHGGIRPYVATYFVFTDYAKPAIRIAAIMKQPVIYVTTHDSIGLGEDGTTHQPIEQLITFRAMPNITVIRPADANETVVAWKAALSNLSGPTMLVLSRQKLPIFDTHKVSSSEGLLKGAYIISKEKGSAAQIILIATGSEVHLALGAQQELQKENIDSRVVSMPSWELFRNQSAAYRNEILPKEITARIAIEAAAPEGWHEWVGVEGKVIAMNTFGESAPAKELFEHFGFTVPHVVSVAKKLMEK